MFKYKYGITVDEYEAMLVEQDHRCKICGTKDEESSRGKLYVDHDHKTKKVRGLLCHGCNTGLGAFKDNAEFLKSAIQYLD